MKKILIIRFSSFGDIVQSMTAAVVLKQLYPQAEIHWLTKKNFSPLVGLLPQVSSIIGLDGHQGIKGLLKLGLSLRHEKYDLIYDAHNNLRSAVLRLMLGGIFIARSYQKLLVRPKYRWKRFLLFKFKINKFPWPFKGMQSYVDPLQVLTDKEQMAMPARFNFPIELENKFKNSLPQEFITLCPSAAWEMKRWPLEHWKELVKLLHRYHVVLLGGPEDTFLQQIRQLYPERITNLAGLCDLVESSYVISRSSLVISADTGLIHVADLLGVKGLSLIGPTAFGFCSFANIKTLEVDLSCRPCSKDGSGRCSRQIYQECMTSISPHHVLQEAERALIP